MHIFTIETFFCAFQSWRNGKKFITETWKINSKEGLLNSGDESDDVESEGIVSGVNSSESSASESESDSNVEASSSLDSDNNQDQDVFTWSKAVKVKTVTFQPKDSVGPRNLGFDPTCYDNNGLTYVSIFLTGDIWKLLVDKSQSSSGEGNETQ